jgi:phosphoglycerate dehydrogenase-like enzyme
VIWEGGLPRRVTSDHPFRKLENVLATPHIGYVTEDLYRTFDGDAAASIAKWPEANATAA